MAEQEYVSVTGHGPVELTAEGDEKVFENIIARSMTELDVVYSYVDEKGNIAHKVQTIELTYEPDSDDNRLFWDNE